MISRDAKIYNLPVEYRKEPNTTAPWHWRDKNRRMDETTEFVRVPQHVLRCHAGARLDISLEYAGTTLHRTFRNTTNRVRFPN